MQISKRRLAAKPQVSKVVWLAVQKTDCPECRQADRSVGMWTVPSSARHHRDLRASTSPVPCRAEDAVAVGFAKGDALHRVQSLSGEGLSGEGRDREIDSPCQIVHTMEIELDEMLCCLFACSYIRLDRAPRPSIHRHFDLSSTAAGLAARYSPTRPLCTQRVSGLSLASGVPYEIRGSRTR
jgi:hypothetical protein